MAGVRRIAVGQRWLATVLSAALLVSGGGSVARGDDIEAARQHFIQGSKHFDLGRYDDAIKEYMAAYEAKPDPALLYNIAQAHKLAGHPAEAIRFYRIYLLRVPDAQNANEVRAKIVELQKAIEQQQKAQSMPPDQTKPLGSIKPSTTIEPASPAPPPTVTPSAPPAVAPAVTPSAEVAQPAPIEVRRPGRTLEIAGLSIGVLGVATLATGIGLSVVAKQDSDQLTMLARQQGVFDPAKDSSGRTLGTAGPALIGVGAALAIAGGVVAILGLRASHKPAGSTARADGSSQF